ncbi:MAG: HNH endonuclease [Novosphingobium sp.]
MRPQHSEPAPREEPSCWLCARPLGRRVEWHHPVPKSRGGRVIVPLHPVCHRAIHANFTNAELARGGDGESLRKNAEVAKFLAWIADKPPDFHVRTARRRK